MAREARSRRYGVYDKHGNRINLVYFFYFPISFATWEYSRDLHFALRHLPEKFDLVHITSVFLSASALGAHYAKKFKKPYVISPR